MANNWKPLIIGAITGTMVMFIWGAAEWLNPFLSNPYRKPVDSEVINKVLLEQLPENGIYVWPNGPETKTEAGKPRGLMYFMAKQETSFYNPGRFMTIQLLTQMVTWLLITYLLLLTEFPSHRTRLVFILLLGLLAGLTFLVPMWNWWGFSTEYVLTRWLNLLVGWLLAGLAISHVLRKYFVTQ